MNKTNLTYKHARESEKKRLLAERDEAKRILNASPQLLEARHNSPYPDVYFHFKRKAHNAWNGALAMWGLCLILGGGFSILSYDLSWLPTWLSGLIVFTIWAVVTLMIGVGTEKIVAFGLDISPSAPFSISKAIKGIIVCGILLGVSFAGLLLLRTLISLSLLIALQAAFEISAICAGSFFKAIYEFYIELPELKDRITKLDTAIDKIEAELAFLAMEAGESVSPPPPFSPAQAQHVGVMVNVPAIDSQRALVNGHVASVI